MNIKDVKIGQKIVADGCFTCMGEGAVRTVMKGENGLPYIRCSEGQHYLAGQVGRGGSLIGLKRHV